MSFRRELEYLREQPREVKQIKKLLPFTVRDIGNGKDLAEWKRIKAEKEEIWIAGRAERYAAARQRAIDVLSGDRKPKETANDKADKRFKEITQEQNERFIQASKQEMQKAHKELTSKLTEIPKPSLLSRIFNFFTNINFEPK